MKLLLLLALLLTLDACQNPSRVLAALHQDQFAINLKTAGTLGLIFSLPLLARADEVLEYVAVHESAVDAVPSQDTERRVNGHKAGRSRHGKFTP